MDRIPDSIDMAVVADRFRPLAHQASEGLRQTSDSLRHSLDQARDVIAERIEEVDVPAFDLEPAAALAMAAESLPFLRRRARARAGRSPLQWFLIAVAVTVATVAATFVLNAIARRIMAERQSSALAARPAPRAVAPVAIPITHGSAPSEVAGAEEAVEDLETEAIEDAEAMVEERAVEAG